LLHRAAADSTEPWARYIHHAHLLRVLLAAGDRHEAEAVAADLVPMVGTVASARTEKLLRGLPPVGDALPEIRDRLSGLRRS
jgi:predicted NAD-dependent protein-ADP-ribosyltransferase YbiA (DUF1768 family)